MFKGFYNLTSGMLTQTRNLDVIANNMSNTATAGFKTDRYADTTFHEVMVSRIGNKDKTGAVEIGAQSYITTLGEVRTNHKQGALQETGMKLDFGIDGDGYFAIEGANERVYTRNGSFMLDEQGYLALSGQGRVLGQGGQPIYLGTDNFSVDLTGTISAANGQQLGRIGVFAFADPQTDLQKSGEGVFTAIGQPQASDAVVNWKMVERSNIDLVQQMADMMTCQRALQSAAQVSKMYDQIMTKSATEIGRL